MRLLLLGWDVCAIILALQLQRPARSRPSAALVLRDETMLLFAISPF